MPVRPKTRFIPNLLMMNDNPLNRFCGWYQAATEVWVKCAKSGARFEADGTVLNPSLLKFHWKFSIEACHFSFPDLLIG
jgi:hypothetical protein